MYVVKLDTHIETADLEPILHRNVRIVDFLETSLWTSKTEIEKGRSRRKFKVVGVEKKSRTTTTTSTDSKGARVKEG